MEDTLLAYSAFAAVTDLLSGQWVHAVFSSVNAVCFLFVIVRFVGLRENIQDITGPRKRVGPAVA